MKKIHCVSCNKYRKFKSPKFSYIFDKTLVLSIICDDESVPVMMKKHLMKKNQLTY